MTTLLAAATPALEEAGPTLAGFLDAWELFADPVLAGGLAGGLLGLLGVYIVLRRMVFLSAALSQAAGLGVSMQYFLLAWSGAELHDSSPIVGALAMTGLTTALLWSGRSAPPARRDALLGLAWIVGAAGTLALGTRLAQELHDVDAVLFGSAVVVLPEDVRLVAAVTVLVGVVHLLFVRGFLAASFDPEGAAVRGVPVRLLDAVLLGTLALSVSVATRVLGALPSFAFSVLPALAAVRLCANVPRALLLSAVLGLVAGVAGYLVAYFARLPVGASQALVAALGLVLAEAVAVVRRRGD